MYGQVMVRSRPGWRASRAGASRPARVDAVELRADQGRRALEPLAVRGLVRPRARTGRVGEGDRDRLAEREALADVVGQPLEAENAAGSEPAHGHDEHRAQQPHLRVEPGPAELCLAGGGQAVAATGRALPRIAARHGRAVEEARERVLVEVEPAAKRAARTSAPRAALLALDRARRLADEQCPLARPALEHRRRRDREPRLRARTAGPAVALQGGERAVAAGSGQRRLGLAEYSRRP